MKLGVLSDTHDHLDDRVTEIFLGVDLILHAGDVCRPSLIAELEAVAPVTVVLGNNDSHPAWRETAVVETGGHRILVEHIVNPHRPARPLQERLLRIQPQVVVFGHTHKPFCEVVDGIVFLNPGAAGPSRFGLPRTVCLADLQDGTLSTGFVPLEPVLPGTMLPPARSCSLNRRV